ncbi:Crp/Fnr family transcriptional regulator, partial [Staphylococcus aureus]|nr:Crp/Fnr family transcriptional regulator [Staphylococcus aureus]
MTENFILGRNNKLEHELKALADYINIPYSILQPYQSECFVRHYTKGQVIYFSPQES